MPHNSLDDDDFEPELEDDDCQSCPECGADIYADSEQCPACQSYVTWSSSNAWSGRSAAWRKAAAIAALVALLAPTLLGLLRMLRG